MISFKKNNQPFIIAGPCSAESESQMMIIAESFRDANVDMIRAGVWKPRTKPGLFEGMGAAALPWLKKTKELSGKPICIEVANPEQLELALEYNIDCIWIGARTTVSPFAVQEIADALKGIDIPVLIKNPVNPDIDLWQGGIERIMKAGITQIGAIHRGFSSHDKSIKYRNKPNWAIPIELRRRMPQLPILVDPSHMGGKRELIAPLSQRAMDLQFDGLMIEAHPEPDLALSDAAQQVTPNRLIEILDGLILRNSSANISEQKLEELRQIVDSIDAELVDVLSRRMEVIKEIGGLKKEMNLSVYQPERYKEIIDHITKLGEINDIHVELLKKIMEHVHDMSIKTQLKIMNS